MPRNRLVNPLLGAVAAASQPDSALLYPSFAPIMDVRALGTTGTLLVRDSRLFYGNAGARVARARLADRSQGETLPYSAQTYALEQSAHEIPLDNFYDSPYVDQTGTLMEDTAESCGRVVKLKLEQKLQDKVEGAGSSFTASTLALLTGLGGQYATAKGASWDTDASDPIQDLKAIRNEMRTEEGITPDTVSIPFLTLSRLGTNAALKGYHRGATAVGHGERHLDENAVAQVIQANTGMRVIMPEALVNTAAINATKDLADIWQDVWIGKTGQSGSNRIVRVSGQPGLTIDRVALVGLQLDGFTAGTWQSDDGLKTVPYAESDIDWHVVDSALGFTLTTVFF